LGVLGPQGGESRKTSAPTEGVLITTVKEGGFDENVIKLTSSPVRMGLTVVE